MHTDSRQHLLFAYGLALKLIASYTKPSKKKNQKKKQRENEKNKHDEFM